MPVELFANLPQTTVLEGGLDVPSPGTIESWLVQSSSPFPASSTAATPPTQFHIADIDANSEIIAVENVAGDIWTVVRGAEGTAPVLHSANFTVFQVVTAAGLNGFLQSANNLTDVNSADALVNLGAVPSAGGTMTGPLYNDESIVAGVVVLTYAPTLNLNAELGGHFRVTLTGNATVAAPSNPVDGQKITFEIIQDSTGSRLLTWTSGTGGYDFGSATAPLLSTEGGKRDIIGFLYSASAGEWLYGGFLAGF